MAECDGEGVSNSPLISQTDDNFDYRLESKLWMGTSYTALIILEVVSQFKAAC